MYILNAFILSQLKSSVLREIWSQTKFYPWQVSRSPRHKFKLQSLKGKISEWIKLTNTNLNKMKTRHVWTKTPGKFEEKSDETGMPRIDGTSKSKRLENPGHPQTLPGDKEPPSVFCFNHPLLGVLVFNRGRSFYILKFGQMRFAIQVTHSSYHIWIIITMIITIIIIIITITTITIL